MYEVKLFRILRFGLVRYIVPNCGFEFGLICVLNVVRKKEK